MNTRHLIILSLSLALASCNKEKEPEVQSVQTPYISKVFDYSPAPGQFINQMPQYAANATKEQMVKLAKTNIAGIQNGTPITLGGFGGYIIFGFDHTVQNIDGQRDFRIMGNAFDGGSEPGIVMVAYDTNKNGLPDNDEWYEIEGSESKNSASLAHYQITYNRPQSEALSDNYISWSDNKGVTGFMPKNTYHSQPYYPQWITESTLVFSGTRLPDNGTDVNGDGTLWVQRAYGRGYADNAQNSDADSAIDIAWAVDGEGRTVKLAGIDFVKVYTAVRQQCGWIGEASTEIAGAYDLHLMKEVVPSN